MLRLDVAIGAVAALVTILVAPGIAMAAIIAVLVLIVAGVWLLVERRRAGAGHAAAGASSAEPRQFATTAKKSRV